MQHFKKRFYTVSFLKLMVKRVSMPMPVTPRNELINEIQNLKEEWNPRVLTQERMDEIKNSVEYLVEKEYFDNEIEIFTPSGSSLKSFMKNIIRSADLNRWKNYRHPQNIGGIIFNPTSKSLQGWVMISPQKIAFSAKLDIGWVKTNTKGYDSTQLLDKACKDRKIRWKGDSSIPIFYTNYSPKNFTVEKVKDFISELKNILSDIRIVKIHD